MWEVLESVGILPNDAAFVRLVGAIMLEQNDDGRCSGATCKLRGGRPRAILRRLGARSGTLSDVHPASPFAAQQGPASIAA